jgi:predicted nucleotidyltransferase
VNKLFGGRDHLFSLNRENNLVERLIIPLFSEEKTVTNEMFGLLVERYKDIVVSIDVFGSAVKGTEYPGSDLDVCLVISDDSAREQTEEKAFSIYNDFKNKFGITVSNTIFTLKDIISRNGGTDDLLQNIVKESKHLYGKNLKEILRG